jgi:hypothetical protein
MKVVAGRTGQGKTTKLLQLLSKVEGKSLLVMGDKNKRKEIENICSHAGIKLPGNIIILSYSGDLKQSIERYIVGHDIQNIFIDVDEPELIAWVSLEYGTGIKIFCTVPLNAEAGKGLLGYDITMSDDKSLFE